MKVQQVIPEADGIVSIVIAGKHIRELDAESGQFFRWRFLSAKTWMTAQRRNRRAVLLIAGVRACCGTPPTTVAG